MRKALSQRMGGKAGAAKDQAPAAATSIPASLPSSPAPVPSASDPASTLPPRTTQQEQPPRPADLAFAQCTPQPDAASAPPAPAQQSPSARTASSLEPLADDDTHRDAATTIASEAVRTAESRLSSSAAHEEEDYSLEQMDRFDCIVEVGRGAQGVVYQCTDTETGQILALKELKGLGGMKISPEIEMEIAVMKHLEHPNLTRLYEVFDVPESNSLFLVLEFVDGGPVMDDKAVLAGTAEPLALDFAQSVFQQLIRALSFLHYRGVLHRDIKPSNVLISKATGQVKLSDFGVASFTNRHKSARILGEDDIIYVGTCGTPAMLSPEALGAGPDSAFHGRPADVWAAGVTLYCMLYGKLPFSGKDSEEMVERIFEQPLAFPHTSGRVPHAAKDVLAMMLHKDPSKRSVLSAVANHPWVNCGNWKADLTPAQLDVMPSREAVSHPISAPRVFSRIRKTATTALQLTSTAALNVGDRVKRVGSSASQLTSTPSVVPKPDPVFAWFSESFCCSPETRKL